MCYNNKICIPSSLKVIMYNPFISYLDSCYYFSIPSTPVYFTYDPWINSPKTASNIILIKNQSDSTNASTKVEKSSETQQDQCKRFRVRRKQKLNFTQKRQNKNRRQNQVTPRRKPKVANQSKKAELVQKQGRNSHSNILRKFFKLLSMESQFRALVGKIMKKLGLEMSVQRYFTQMRAKNIDHRNYIRVKEVEGVFEYNKSWVNQITRILFQNYLQSYYVEHLLSSKKTDNKSVVFHLKGKRSLREDLYGKKAFQSDSNYNCFSQTD